MEQYFQKKKNKRRVVDVGRLETQSEGQSAVEAVKPKIQPKAKKT